MTKKYFKITSTNIWKYFLIPAMVLMSVGCSYQRYLEEGQQLYTGSDITIESEEKISQKSEVESEINNVLRPKPNERILYWRYRLWLYNVPGKEPGNALSKWVKGTLGRPPVLWENFDGERSAKLIKNRLFNMGFFDAQVEYTPVVKPQKASAEFLVRLSPAYTISEILPLEDTTLLAEEINSSLDKSLLQPDQTYRLNRLKEERNRITKYLRDKGYFFFNPDFILFKADTTAAERQVKLAFSLPSSIPDNAHHKFQIRNIYINVNHDLSTDNEQTYSDSTALEDGVFLYNNNDIFKHITIQRAVFLEKDNFYNTKDHDLTINHLMGLGVFKFVNLRFNPVEDKENNFLDVNILLTQMQKKSLSAEISGVSKSSNFAGPGLSISFTNRNFLRGAENFSINLDGSYEWLMGKGQGNISSLETGITSELLVPRFVAPFGINNISPMFIPQTRFLIGFSHLSRTNAFSVSTYRSQIGYEWRQSVTSRYQFNPFVFNFFSLGNISEDYEQFFTQEILFRRGLFEQFLLGGEFSFTWNTQLRGPGKHSWYVNYNLDSSGNLTYLLLDGLNMGELSEEGDYEIFNQSFSQFTRTSFDTRYYLDLGHDQKLVTRIAAGVGIPYGNSSILPYVKLFTTGGSNSIRAFQPRSLGPGAYNPPDSLRNTFNIYQTGEIKLELNLEYRIAFTSLIHGALFVDAGNVWNIEERENAPGGKFEKDEFLNQIALGTGLGLRFDFTFFILRLDLAFPLAVPYDDSPGYFQPFEPFNSSWLGDNLLLNLAIGYPF